MGESHVLVVPYVDWVMEPFQRLLDRHAGEIHGFLVALVGRVDAEDCFQETFLSALKAYPRLAHHDDHRAWLFTIARRKAIDHFRATARRPVPTDELPESAERPADGDSIALVAKLPEKQRAAVALKYVTGLPYRDVARIMDCSVEAARRSAHEGIKRLREEWDG